MNIFHRHKWVPKKVNNLVRYPQWLIEGNYQKPGYGDPITKVLYGCKECGERQTKELEGIWELKDLI